MDKTKVFKKMLSIALAVIMLLSVVPILNFGLKADAAYASSDTTYCYPLRSISNTGRGFTSSHNGVDFTIASGTPVYAVFNGTVKTVYSGCKNNNGASGTDCKAKGCSSSVKTYMSGSGYKAGYYCNYGYGNGVVIQHTDGKYSFYAHLSSVSVKVGDKVNQNTKIGTVGSAGCSTGPHLHFSIGTSASGSYQNPFNYIFPGFSIVLSNNGSSSVNPKVTVNFAWKDFTIQNCTIYFGTSASSLTKTSADNNVTTPNCFYSLGSKFGNLTKGSTYYFKISVKKDGTTFTSPVYSFVAAAGDKTFLNYASVSTSHKHSYTANVTTAPTCEKEGVRTYTCSCGASYTETIPKEVPVQKESTVWNGHEYILFIGKSGWDFANSYAENVAERSHLVTITSREEQDIVNDLIDAYKYSYGLWYGAENESTGEYRWVTGEPFEYTYWAEGEPTGGSDTWPENYLGTCFSTLWNDYNKNSTTPGGFVVEVDPLCVIETQPKSVAKSVGSTAKFTVAATGTGTLSYQWRVSTDGTNWTNTKMTGYNTPTLQVPVKADKNGYKFRCVVKDLYGSVSSSTATLTVTKSTAKITTQPKSVTQEIGTTAKFTVNATGSGTISCQWKVSADGTNWTNSKMTGYNTPTLKVPVKADKNGYKFCCVVTDANGSVTSSTATLTVIKSTAKITTQPKNLTQTTGTTAKFTVAATGSGTLSYQWKVSTDGTNWTNSKMTGYNTATLQVPVKADKNGYKFMCVVTDANGSVKSSTATLTVIKSTAKITAQPNSVIQSAGTTAKFTVAATGSGTLSYQWKVSTDGVNWTNSKMTGYNTNTLQVPVKADKDGYKFICVVTDANGSVTSSAATLTVA